MMKSIIKVQLLLCLAVLCVLPASAGNGRGVKPSVVDDDSTIIRPDYAYGIEPYRLLGVRSGDRSSIFQGNLWLEYDAQGKVGAVTCLTPHKMYTRSFGKTTYTYEPKAIKAVCMDLESSNNPVEEHLYRLDNQGRIVHCVSTLEGSWAYTTLPGQFFWAYTYDPLVDTARYTFQTFYRYDNQNRLQEIVCIDTLLYGGIQDEYDVTIPTPDTTVTRLKWDGDNVVQVISKSNRREADTTVYTYTNQPDAFGASMFGGATFIYLDAPLWMQGYYGKRNANLLKSIGDDTISRTWGVYDEVLKENETEYFWEYYNAEDTSVSEAPVE